MDLLLIIHRTSYVLMILSLIYTLYQFYISYKQIELKLRRQNDLTSKILTLMKNRHSNRQIYDILIKEGYLGDDIISKMKDIYDMLGVKRNQEK